MVHSANYRPGESGNPSGRPTGSRNKRTTEVINQIIASGNKDPLLILSDLSANHEDPYLRAQACNMLAPYLHSKLGAVAAPPIPIFIENQINIPHVEPKTITQSNENILYLTNLKAIGKLDLAWGDSLIADQCRVRDGLIDDAKLAIQGHEQGDQVIRIEGGMPALPGTDIIMPAINGREYDILSAYSPAIESIASDAPVPLPPDQEPGPEG